MDGNEYHDQKGHFTTKENDGGRCFHEGLLSRKSEVSKKEYLVEQGFKKERYNRKMYYSKEVGSYKDKFGNKHPIFMIYSDGKIFYSDSYIANPNGENAFDTFDKAAKKQKQKYDFDSALRKFDYLKEEDPQKYEEIKQELEERAKKSIFIILFS